MDRLTDAQTAYGAINSVQDLIGHPQLRTRAMTVNGQSVQGFRCRRHLIGWNGMSPSFAARRRSGSTASCLSPRNSTRLRFDRCQDWRRAQGSELVAVELCQWSDHQRSLSATP